MEDHLGRSFEFPAHVVVITYVYRGRPPSGAVRVSPPPARNGRQNPGGREVSKAAPASPRRGEIADFGR